MIRKVQQINNSSGTLFFTIPKKYAEKMRLEKGCEVSLELTGKTMHIKRAVIL